MATQSPAAITLSIRETYFLVVIATLVAGYALFHDIREPVASVETRFTERSAYGLNIVPASCPSSPHYDGQCSGGGGGGGGNPPPMLPPVDGSCPVGYLAVGNWCFFVGCPSGYYLSGGQCVPLDKEGEEGGLCSPTYFCAGNDQYYRNAQCGESLSQTCAFSCSGGGCLAAPAGDGNITVSPSLVRSGERTTVSWTTNDMLEDSCTVVENNPEINDTDDGPEGSFVSSVIHQQTSYTLRCTREDESIFTDSATVNILPIFQES